MKKQVKLNPDLSFSANLDIILKENLSLQDSNVCDFVLLHKSTDTIISNMKEIQEGEWYLLKYFAEVFAMSLSLNEKVSINGVNEENADVGALL